MEHNLRIGWTMKQIVLDSQGKDEFGWHWGHGLPLWHFTDGVDSLTVRAEEPLAAYRIAAQFGWPPTRIGRIDWGREFTAEGS